MFDEDAYDIYLQDIYSWEGKEKQFTEDVYSLIEPEDEDIQDIGYEIMMSRTLEDQNVFFYYFSYKYNVTIQLQKHYIYEHSDEFLQQIIIYPDYRMSDMKMFQNKFPYNDNVDISLLYYMPPPPFNGGNNFILG